MRAPWVLALVHRAGGAHAQLRVVNAREQAKRDIETECVRKSVYAWKNERERARERERKGASKREECERARKWERERENVEELLRWMTFITIKQNKNMDYLHNIINNYYVYYDY